MSLTYLLFYFNFLLKEIIYFLNIVAHFLRGRRNTDLKTFIKTMLLHSITY